MLAGAEPITDAIHAGLIAGGTQFVSYLPDSRFARLEQRLESDPGLTTVRCSREDEGVAVAVGAAMGGFGAVSIMEGTGLGLCGLILARARLQHTPLLLLVSHTSGPGESKPFHATAIAASAAILRGFDIPCAVLSVAEQAEAIVAQTVVTVRAQRTICALALPGLVHATSEATVDAAS